MLTGQLLRIPHGFSGLLRIAPGLLQPRQHGIGNSLNGQYPPTVRQRSMHW